MSHKSKSSDPRTVIEKVKWIDEALREQKRNGLIRRTICIDSPPGPKISIGGRSFINFSSNDYLGLSGNPQIKKAAIAALKRFGLGSGASRLLSGTYQPHATLEHRLARFKGTEAAILFNTGYAANTGIIPALARKGTVVFSDELNHASIIDGIKLSCARVSIYRHRDMEHLELHLKRSFKYKGTTQRMIITDTVFSMDGDIAPLPDILSLCRKYDAILLIDEAHATGVLGETGKGGLEHFDIRSSGRVIQMGTLSKAFGCFGAYIAGSRGLITFLTGSARSFMYSTALPPSVAAACMKAVDIVESGSGPMRKKLWKNRERLSHGLRSIGYDTLGSETPIIPVLIGETKSALKAGNHLFRKGIFAPAIRPPSVPDGKCRLRFTVTALHTKSDVDHLLDALRKNR